MMRFISSSLLMITMLMPPAAGAGKLGDTADRVEHNSSNRSSRSWDSGDDDDDDAEFCFIICLLLELLDGNEEEESGTHEITTRGLLPRPYARGYSGYKIIETTGATESIENSPEAGQTISEQVTPDQGNLADGRAWAARIGTDYQYDWGNVHLGTAVARLESSVGLGLFSRWTGFFEPTDTGTDTLSLLEGGFFWDLAPFEQVKLELGGGVLGMFHGDEGYAGGTAGLRIDIFPKKPLVISGELSIGGINKTLYLRGRGTLGVLLGPVEIFAGYDGQRFGANDAIVYHGPLAGIRMWL